MLQQFEQNYELMYCDETEMLRGALAYEKLLREQAEQEIIKLKHEIEILKSSPIKKKSKEEIRKQNLEKVERLKSGVKKDGKPIPHAGNSLKNYDEFVRMKNALLSSKKFGQRNYAMFVLGINMGLRAGDLRTLRYYDFLNDDLSFKERVYVCEEKTGKINETCLITEAMKQVLAPLIPKNSEEKLSDYIFKSNKSKDEPIEVDAIRKIINGAAEKANIGNKIGSHGMRKTFSNIIATIDGTVIPEDAIAKVQAHLNHSNPTITMRYIGALETARDKEKQTVSDFLLGNTEKKELVFEEINYEKDIVDKLDKLIELIGVSANES